VLLGEVVEGDEVLPISLQAVGRIPVSLGPQLSAVRRPPTAALSF
jgi:hypothetical protein